MPQVKHSFAEKNTNAAQVSAAAAAYKNGNYAEAIEIYRALAQSMGEKFFAANILLCERRLVTTGTDAVAIATQHAIQIRGTIGIFENIQLSQKEPVWHPVAVTARQRLAVKTAVEYQNTGTATDRKAVFLLECFDAHGKYLDKPCGKMSKSAHLNAYFKYLPCTRNQLQDFHTFVVPDGCATIRLGLCGFNQKKNERVLVRQIVVETQTDETKPVKFTPPSAQAAAISIREWPEYPANGKPYVIGIMDEFTTGCFEQDVNLIQPRPDNWFALAEKYPPAFFFIESAWKGNYGSWQYRVADYANKPGNEVAQLCEYARKKDIPTLFWNKEDPVHHAKFMCSARLVDHIFTTDANMKPSYQAKTNNPNVHTLPFAAQPALHKPVPLAGRKPRTCFAGSWYGDRHEARGKAMRWLLQAANKYGLDIYDRNYGTGNFPFPEEYQAGIKGSLPYKDLCAEYGRYRVFLNVNSVTDSPTMFSRRVFELMACGTPVVSTYSKGIETLFESDAIWMVHSQEEAEAAIHTLMTDDTEWRRRSLAGIREVFSKHTYRHRLNDIFSTMGLENLLSTEPFVTLIAAARNPSELAALNQFALKQSYRRFQLGVVWSPHQVGSIPPLSENITLLTLEEKPDWLSAQRHNATLAGWLAPEIDYGPHYLRDLVNATLYAEDASGWAKSVAADCFSCAQPALLGGAIWRISEFLDHHQNGYSLQKTRHEALYVADADQFQASVSSSGTVRKVEQ